MNPATPASVSDAEHKRIINAWCLYDWANSGFATIILAAIFPVYYRTLAKAGGASNEDATAYLSYTNAFAMILIAAAGPFLGAMADVCRGKKRFTATFAGCGILGSIGMVFLGADNYLWASALFILGMIGFAGGNIFYESLLPSIARPEELDEVSSKGYAWGYLGGGLLLVICVVLLSFPAAFHLENKTAALKICFLSVGLWWFLFSIPLFRRVPEPETDGCQVSNSQLFRESFRRLLRTLREIRRYRDLTLFLVAFWIYNDGISTIIKLATAFGDEIGVQQQSLILALVLTQFIGIPSAILFGKLGKHIGAKKCILIGLAVYTGICVLGFYMKTAAHFFVLAGLVGVVQGGTQALSRSLFTTMVPKNRSAEFFGLFSTGAKFAGILGPLVFGLIGQLGGTSRWGILSIIIFFLAGAILLLKVDPAKGREAAGNA